MKTLKLKINKEKTYGCFLPYIIQYTGLFQKLYKHKLNNSCDKKQLLQIFDLLDVDIYGCCKSDVETKIKQVTTIDSNKRKEIEQIEKQLIELNNNMSKNNKNIQHTKRFRKRNKIQKLIYKLNQKLSSLKRNLKSDITFGDKSLLKKISYQSNLKHNPDKKWSDKYNEQLHSQYLKEYRENRLLPFYSVGRAFDNGNRKFKFDFNNDTIIFKPNRKNHIEIKYYAHSNYKKELQLLQQLVDNKQIPITVRLSQDYICLTYDESLLKNIKSINNHQMNTNNLVNKIITNRERYLVIDLNPQEIGYCIVEKDGTQEFGYSVLYKEMVCLKKLSKRLNKSSSDKEQLYQNNKRRFEISQVWKRIFNIANHYIVQCCIVEDLDFKKDKTMSNLTQTKNFNKQVNNIWHRTLTDQLIKKKCNESGIELRTVNASYSSVIGNLSYPDYDPIASSLELARRGINKYIKGNKLYPEVSQIHVDKLNYVLHGKSDKLQVDLNKIKSWKQVYSLLSYSELRYRNKDKYNNLFLSERNIQSYKSKVRAFTYHDNMCCLSY